jgi:hypothetical protein
MVDRIAQLSLKYQQKTGVVEEVVGRLRYYWDQCAGLVVYSMNDAEERLYTVSTQSGGRIDEHVHCYNLNAATKSCDCGLWQEHEYPCIHAVAYYKKHVGYNFDQVLNEVDRKYTYENENLLFRKNFLTVCDDKIVGDKSVLPPVFKKRKAGRTKKKRYRKRSLMFGGSSSRSAGGRCRRCGRKGHNIRTCATTAELLWEEDGGKANEEGAEEKPFQNLNELNLL